MSVTRTTDACHLLPDCAGRLAGGALRNHSDYAAGPMRHLVDLAQHDHMAAGGQLTAVPILIRRGVSSFNRARDGSPGSLRVVTPSGLASGSPAPARGPVPLLGEAASLGEFVVGACRGEQIPSLSRTDRTARSPVGPTAFKLSARTAPSRSRTHRRPLRRWRAAQRPDDVPTQLRGRASRARPRLDPMHAAQNVTVDPPTPGAITWFAKSKGL